MNLLASALYDPAVAVSKSIATLIAMTAIDTTNLRLAVTVPSHGLVHFRIRIPGNGATTLASILLGVLNGATVVGRVAPKWFPGTLSSATAIGFFEAEFTVSGQTPGANNYDLAYAVQVIVAATQLRYGGPNNATGNNAWGGVVFEAWDPRPLTLALNGGVNVTQYGGAAGTFAGGRPEVNVSHIAGAAVNTAAAQLGVNVVNYGGVAGTFAAGRPEVNAARWNGTAPNNLVAGRVDVTVGAMQADVVTAAATAADFGTEIGTAVWATTTRALTDKSGFALTQAFPANFSALAITAGGAVTAGTVSDKTGYGLAADQAVNVTKVGGTVQTARDLGGQLDATVSSRLAGSSYTAPDNAGIAVAAGAAATAATNSSAIKLKTDSLNFTVAGKVDVNLLYVNGILVTGNGSPATPWNPAP